MYTWPLVRVENYIKICHINICIKKSYKMFFNNVIKLFFYVSIAEIIWSVTLKHAAFLNFVIYLGYSLFSLISGKAIWWGELISCKPICIKYINTRRLLIQWCFRILKDGYPPRLMLELNPPSTKEFFFEFFNHFWI